MARWLAPAYGVGVSVLFASLSLLILFVPWRPLPAEIWMRGARGRQGGAVTLYVLIGLRLEEGYLTEAFGAGYRRCRRGTPMLVPGLGKRWRQDAGPPDR